MNKLHLSKETAYSYNSNLEASLIKILWNSTIPKIHLYETTEQIYFMTTWF